MTTIGYDDEKMLPASEKASLSYQPVPQPSAPRRRGRAWGVFSQIVQLVLAFSLLGYTIKPVYDYWYMTPAERVLNRNPLIDGHNDLLIRLRGSIGNHIYTSEFKDQFENGGLGGEVDIPRIEEGRLGGAFWSAFVGCPANGTDFSDENYAVSVRQTLEQIDLFQRLSAEYPKYFTVAETASHAERLFKKNKLISPMGIEGLHQIGNSLSTLRLYHSLGVRYATLTWNCHNAYADAALVSNATGHTVKSTPLWHGVSPAGRDLIREMNRMGMLVDLSHVSDDTMLDVLGHGKHNWTGSLAPPIYSHSSVRAICPHPRNVPDHILKLVKERDGLVMVNFAPDFISCRDVGSDTGIPEPVPEEATLDRVVEHIMYIGELIGYDHVGIGTDFDGIPTVPKGLEDVSKFPDLITALLKKGVSYKDAGKIVGRNLLRVWEATDKVARKLQREMVPIEDDIKRGW